MWWGYSPALDLLEEYGNVLTENNQKEKTQNSVNVLLIEACDGRHIIKTLSQIHRHGKEDTAVNFFVIEKSLETVARQLLLLTLALEPPDILGLQEKTILFLEIFGNAIIRPTTYNYIIQKSHQLIHMITDADYMAKRMPLINVDNLRYRNRDTLENIFKFWQNTKAMKYLNTEVLWDNRLRQYLTNRYDSKLGVFDWDYNMKLCKLGQESISLAEYQKWRLKGIAYSWYDRIQSKPNLTLVSGIQKVNGEVINFGYTGDIENGPFATYGLKAKIDDSNHRRKNPRMCTGYSQRNLMKILHGIVRTTESINVPSESEFEGTVMADDLQENLCSMAVVKEESDSEKVDRKFSEREDYSAVQVGSARVVFLPSHYLSEIHEKDKFKNIFDVIVISHNCIDNFNANLMKTAKCDSTVIVETLNFALSPRKDGHQLIQEKIDKLANDCNCKPIELVGGSEDFFKRFEYHREENSL